MTNLDRVLKSRDITLLTKGHLVKAMAFPAVMYGCESWTIKKAECLRNDAFELWCWRMRGQQAGRPGVSKWRKQVASVRHFFYRRRRWHPTPVLLPGKSHGWRSLVGHSPWDLKESDTTERLHFHFSLSCIGEGNGNPLQYSCLENPRDGGAWWAAVYGVAESDVTEATQQQHMEPELSNIFLLCKNLH